nr:MAG TPA: hypothetical protein [Caudoviricetes sp.]
MGNSKGMVTNVMIGRTDAAKYLMQVWAQRLEKARQSHM